MVLSNFHGIDSIDIIQDLNWFINLRSVFKNLTCSLTILTPSVER